MRQVTVSAVIDATPETILEQLSPRSIIKSKQIYDIEDVAHTDDGWLVTATTVESDRYAEFAFKQQAEGYAYELIGDGPCQELYTTVTVNAGDAIVEGDDEDSILTQTDNVARVTVVSEFTFGGWFAPLLDRFALRYRQEELERMIQSLEDELSASDASVDDTNGHS